MKVHPTGLEGLLRIELTTYRDDRGFFLERFQKQKFRELGLPERFIQVNHSRSRPGVLRGMHYQTNPDQGKLVSVLRGRIYDVAVDIRPASPTFGKWFGLELRDDPAAMLWIPPGFAHGFCVLGEEPADVLYLVDAAWSPSGEKGILWSDPALGIAWPVENPLVSAKDTALPKLRDLSRA